MTEQWTTMRVLEWTEKRFAQVGVESARLEAQMLLAHVLACGRVDLYTNFDKPLSPEELSAYRALIQRRLAREPAAYLVGQQEFWSVPLYVDARVLIPRHDTETVIDVVLDVAGARDRSVRIAEVATGSGAIAVALARELTNATVVATDASTAALEVARRNVDACGVGDRVQLRHGDLLAPLAGEPAFDLVVANLPYIPTAEIDRLAPEVRREPRQALDGGADGLALLRRLIEGAPRAITAGGWLVLEHGVDQDVAVAELIARTERFEPAQLRRDMGGRPRVTYARTIISA